MSRYLPARLPACLLAAVLLAATPALAGTAPDRAGRPDVLIAAAVPDQLPVSAFDGTGQLTGFDIDVSRALAARLGSQVRFVTPGWDAILGGAWDGRWDYCACSITPTLERTHRLDFPASYRFDAAVLVVRNDDAAIASPAQASGKTIGVKAETTFERYLRHDLVIFGGNRQTVYRIDDPAIRLFPSKEAAIEAVANGEVAGTVTALVSARGAIDAGLPVRIVPGLLFFEPVAVATAKGDAAFGAKVAGAVQAMRDDGTLTALSMKWFGIDLTGMLE